MGKISDLIKILKGEGDVAAVRRAERIGDEAPYAAERIDAETLRSVISRGDNANSLAIITPEDFRYLAAPLNKDYLTSPLTSKLEAPAGMGTAEYIQHLGDVAKQQGFRDVPFLSYGEHLGTSQLGVSGHEGRHRMRALEGLGDEKALVRLIPRANVREPLPRRSRSEFLEALAEKYGVPMKLDPEGYESTIVDVSRPVQPFGKGSLVKQSKKFTKKDLSAMGAELETSTGSLVDLARKYPQVKDRSIADIGTLSDEDVIDAYRALVVRKGAPLRKETTPSTTIEPGVALDILQNAPVIIKGNEFIAPEGVLRTYRNVPVSKTEVYVPSLIDEVIEQNIDPADINVKTKRAGKMKLADIFKQVQKERELLADVSELTPEDFVFTVDKGFSPSTLMSVARDVARGRWKGAEDYLKYQHFMDREKAIADLDEFAEDFVKRLQPQKFGAGGLAKFFSAVDEAVANLRQKKGTGEQMLKQIQQSPGVKKEELDLRKLPEKLAGQQKVTQEDIQAMLKAVPAPKLELTVRSNAPQKLAPEDLEKWISKSASRRNAVKIMQQRGYEVVQNPEDPEVIGFMSPAGDILDKEDMSYIFETELEMAYEAVKDTKSRYDAMFEPSGEINGIPVRTLSEEANKDVITEARNDARDALAQYAQLQNQQAAFQEFVDDWEGGLEGVNPPKFSGYQTKGPSENYRELLIRLGPEEKKVIERPPFEYGRQGLGGDPEELAPEEALRRLGLTDMDELGGGDNVESVLYYPSGMYITKGSDGRYYTLANSDDIVTENLAEAEDWLSREMEPELRAPIYEQSANRGRPFVQEAHFPEPDIVVHTRVSDRTGPNGEKILYVDEIQSDWHQAARKARQQAVESIVKYNPVYEELANEARRQVKIDLGIDVDKQPFETFEEAQKAEQMFKKKFAELEKQRTAEEMKKLPKDFGYKKMGTRTAPWSQTSHELAIKQLLDTAANEGYDKVVFAPGSEQVRRYSLGEYFNRIDVAKQEDGNYRITAESKDGRRDKVGRLSAKDLGDAIGEDKAAKAIADIEGGQQTATFEGDDLLLGTSKAQGKLKIYDEIIPQYLSKYAGKEFNLQPGRTAIPIEELEEAKAIYAHQKKTDLIRKLQDDFETGSLDNTELDLELLGMIDAVTRKKARNEIFSPGYGDTSYNRFMQKFASPSQEAIGDIDYLVSQLDPSSFGRGTGMIANIIPEKVRFKDPVKQAEYEEFLEEEWLNTRLRADEQRHVTYPRLVAEAENRILRMSPEELFADMPPLKSVEGASIDITPEMRESIKTRGQPLFAVPPAVGAAAVLSEEEEPVQEYKEAGRVEKKKGMQQEQFDPPFDESRRMGPKPGVSAGPSKIRDLTKILRGENTEAKNLERQRIEGNLQAAGGMREYMYDMLVPQTGWEWAAEAAFFPVPRPVRKGLLAAAGAMYDPEAEAGKLSLLHGSPSKITNLQPGKDLWATTDPEYALKRAMDKMRIAEGAKGPGMVNRFEIEDSDLMRLTDKYSPEDIALARRAFSKLPEGREMTGEEIYEIASTNTGGAKTAALEGVTRALGKKGYQVPAGAADKGDWYRVLDQTDLTPYGKGGIVDAIKNAMKMTETAPDPSRRKAIGLREQITQPGAMTTVETEVSASDLDTLQKAMGNVGQAILNEPVSRREVLKRGALSAASNLIPGGGVLQQLAKEAVPQALQAASSMPSNEALTAMLAKSIGQRVAKIPEADLDDVMDTYPMIQELEPIAYFGDLRYDEDALDSLYGAIGLRTQTLAEELEIPQEKLYELFGTRRVDKKDVPIYSIEELVQPFGDMSEQYRFILEDGRPKEAVRDTSLLDNWNKWARAAIKETLTENREDELEFVQQVQEKMFDRFLSEELANAGLSTGKLQNPIIDALAEELRVKEKAREVFNLALGDKYISSWGSELNNRAIQAFNSGKLGRFTTSFDFDD